MKGASAIIGPANRKIEEQKASKDSKLGACMNWSGRSQFGAVRLYMFISCPREQRAKNGSWQGVANHKANSSLSADIW